MTISSEVRRAGPYKGNGVATVFPFNFKVFTKSDVVVYVTNDAGVESAQVKGFSVKLNADQEAAPGGKVTLAAPLPAGHTLLISSNLPYLQPVRLSNNGGFYPEVINDALDRLTIFAQQLHELLGRVVKGNVGGAQGQFPGGSSPGGGLPPPDNTQPPSPDPPPPMIPDKQVEASLDVRVSSGMGVGYVSISAPLKPGLTRMTIWCSTEPACPAIDSNKVYDGVVPVGIATIRRLADGSALVPDTQYFVRVAVYDADGKDLLADGSPVPFIPLAANIINQHITRTEIADNSISTPMLQANAVRARHIAAGEIVGTHIAANAITSEHIRAGSIGANDIAANAITSAHIQAGAIKASTLGVDKLSALTSNLGEVNSGDISSSVVRGGGFDKAGNWPRSGSGFHLSSNGLRAGNASRGVEITADGNFRAPGMSIINGTLTIDQLRVIKSDNIARGAISRHFNVWSTDGRRPSIVITAHEDCSAIICFGTPPINNKDGSFSGGADGITLYSGSTPMHTAPWSVSQWDAGGSGSSRFRYSASCAGTISGSVNRGVYTLSLSHAGYIEVLLVFR